MAAEILKSNYKTAASITDVGRQRDNNEDAVLLLDDLGCYVVSDGMGGGAAGEIASSTVVTYIRNAIKAAPLLPEARRERFSEAVYAAHSAICAYAEKREYASMGATLAAVLLNPWDPACADVYHAGDSRVYRLRSRRLECLTTDHTVGNASGISEDQMPSGMSGLLSNVVGISKGFFITDTTIDIRSGDTLLICSDGLYRQIREDWIVNALRDGGELKDILRGWVNTANEAEGIDNLSAILIRFDKLPDKYEPSEEELRLNAIPGEPSAADKSSDSNTIV